MGPPRLARARLLQASRPLDAEQEIAQAEADLQDDPLAVIAAARVALQREMAKPPAARSWDDINRRIERLKSIAPGRRR